MKTKSTEKNKAVVQSLIDSLEGLKRLGETIDEELLIRSKEILKELKKLQ